jgi:hypothetical protein
MAKKADWSSEELKVVDHFVSDVRDIKYREFGGHSK